MNRPPSKSQLQADRGDSFPSSSTRKWSKALVATVCMDSSDGAIHILLRGQVIRNVYPPWTRKRSTPVDLQLGNAHLHTLTQHSVDDLKPVALPIDLKHWVSNNWTFIILICSSPRAFPFCQWHQIFTGGSWNSTHHPLQASLTNFLPMQQVSRRTLRLRTLPSDTRTQYERQSRNNVWSHFLFIVYWFGRK